jgi:hypothetical protein
VVSPTVYSLLAVTDPVVPGAVAEDDGPVAAGGAESSPAHAPATSTNTASARLIVFMAASSPSKATHINEARVGRA